MSLLFKHLRIHQVFGANTDVGKTLLTTALVRASAASNKPVFYLKPVSTGPPEGADDKHIQRYTTSLRERVSIKCLFQYQEPVSPHLAAKLAADNGDLRGIPSDDTFANSVANFIRQCASKSLDKAHMYVETAGGIHSPTLSGTTQAEAYRSLFLPTILIGDSKLGGISTTISAYEALVLRGYVVDCILLFRDEYYRNWEYLKDYFADRGVRVSTVQAPPERLADPSRNFEVTDRYYQGLLNENADDGIPQIITHLDNCHEARIADLQSMPRRTLNSVWWPFVQHGLFQDEKDVMVIDSAYSDYFSIQSPNQNPGSSLLQPQFDGSASWWTQTFGHTNSSLTLAAARAAGRYGHVMFPRATHLPALQLAEYLVNEGPGKGWASRAFFSDDGSTGMEIALKMALRAYTSRQGSSLTTAEKKSLGILGLKGSYHGDTIGAMDACEEGVYTCEWHNARGYWLDPPSVSIQNGKPIITLPAGVSSSDSGETMMPAESLSWIYDVEARLQTPQADIYGTWIRRVLDNLQPRQNLAALVIEPLVLGAGGMIFVDPLFQRVLVDAARKAGLPVIFDEVFVGLHRVGPESATSILGVKPDISVNAKVLTGGLVPLAVTLASDWIFRAFLSNNKADALLHGHSYTAHAIGCEVANETLRLIQKVVTGDHWKAAQQSWQTSDTPSTVFSLWDPSFIDAVSKNPSVQEVMTLGTVLAIKLKDDDAGYASHSAEAVFKDLAVADTPDGSLSVSPGGAPFGVHFRTLGNVAYFITSLNSAPSTLRSLEDKIWRTL
ncbi:onanonoxo-7-onima-8-eninoihtemlysoneda [Moniliophthora roreri MCA 2997]|uniref:Onanonoxo-7-onima-8-eninoihtemlysoneda n=1 Tax=Moniliophthora roreri (strain MCA 2997) TaxID=1381753 RepID=V2XHP4_MONRO|nr:onanonoxo-7-onima-8-eninoihtemlysoneda [Moniliophthora roreri MCA 2997]